MEIFLTSAISVVITALFGFMFYKISVRKNKIKHFYINSYEIGSRLMYHFPKLNINYSCDRFPVDDDVSIVVLVGGFINEGKNIGEKTEIKIEMELPSNCQAIDAIAMPCSRGLDVKCDIKSVYYDNNIVQFEIEKQFLSDELFVYYVLVKSDQSLRWIRKETSFNHRMVDTKKIEQVNIKNEDIDYHKRKLIIYKYLSFTLIGAFSLLLPIIFVVMLFILAPLVAPFCYLLAFMLFIAGLILTIESYMKFRNCIETERIISNLQYYSIFD